MLAIFAFFVEKRYLSRLVIPANAFLLWQVFVPVWKSLPDYLQIYVYLSILFTGLAIVSYIRKFPLSKIFYQTSYALYSSKTVLGLWVGISIASFLSLSIDNQIISGLIIAVIIWFVAVKYLGHKLPIKA
jgi:hypothetical protein